MQTNHNFITEILNRFSTGVTDALLMGNEEIKDWPQPAFKLFQKIGVIKAASPAKIVDCPGCEEACLMPVESISGDDVRPSRIFIICDKREDTGRVPIDENNLKHWQIDVEQLARSLAAALETDIIPEEVLPNRGYYLGTLTINRKRRAAIFTGNSEDLETIIESGQLDQYPNPFFLVAGGKPSQKVLKQGQSISLLKVLELFDNRLAVDMDTLKLSLSTKKEKRHDVIPFSVAAGSEWKHVSISFVNEHTVLIRVGTISEYRSYDEMGFSDARKNAEFPIELWGIFRKFAQLQGEVSWDNSQGAFSNPDKVKKYVSEIRKKMKAIFPDIKGDPFFPYRKVKSYKSRFMLNFFPSAM